MSDHISKGPFVDLADPETFAEGIPHGIFSTLRREDPVYFNPEIEGSGFWAITKACDIRAVHRDWETFSSETGGVSIEDLAPHELEGRRSMIFIDPVRHDELRAIVNRRFTPRAVGAWEETVRGIVREVLDGALPLEEFDFVEHVSSEIPMRVLADILGIPAEERRTIIDLGDRLIGGQDPEFPYDRNDPEVRALPLGNPAAREIFEIGRRIAARRLVEPRDDIITQLAFGGLSEFEFDRYFLLLAVAGNETTRHTLTHGALAVFNSPDQFDLLREDVGRMRGAAEEMLRWATPIYHFRRTATRDVELGGKLIKAGDKVVTWFASGNFDEEIFDRAEVFDVLRSPNPHMAFGPGGVHHCLGAHLARLEVRVVFEELIARNVTIEVVGSPDWLRSNFINGIKRLPVRVR